MPGGNLAVSSTEPKFLAQAPCSPAPCPLSPAWAMKMTPQLRTVWSLNYRAATRRPFVALLPDRVMPSRSSGNPATAQPPARLARYASSKQQTTSSANGYYPMPSTATAPTSTPTAWPIDLRLAFGLSPQRLLGTGCGRETPVWAAGANRSTRCSSGKHGGADWADGQGRKPHHELLPVFRP